MIHRIITLIPVAFLAISGLAQAAPTLKIGDSAPPIKAAKWLKGEAVESYDPARIHVVEFWATWCGPCIQTMPHLTKLAEQYGDKVRIIGMNIWEMEKTDHAKRVAQVEAFVAKMGAKMNYTVATDDNDGSTAKAFMEAAGETGIPTSFVIGRDGRIVWIGHPGGAMFDKVLADAVADKLDVEAIAADAAARRRQKDERTRVSAVFQPVGELRAAGKYAEALEMLDRIAGEHPDLAESVEGWRYSVLLQHDQPAAWKIARKLVEGPYWNSPSALYKIARDLSDPPGPKTPDWDLAIAAASRCVEVDGGKNPDFVWVLGQVYAGKGDLAKAIATAEKAISLLDGTAEDGRGNLEYMKRGLERYRRLAAQGAEPSAPRP